MSDFGRNAMTAGNNEGTSGNAMFGGGDNSCSVNVSQLGIVAGMKHALDTSSQFVGLPPMKKRHFEEEQPEDDSTATADAILLNLNPMQRLLAAASAVTSPKKVTATDTVANSPGLLSNSGSVATLELATRLDAFQEAQRRSSVSRELLARATEGLQTTSQQQQLSSLLLMGRRPSLMGCSTGSSMPYAAGLLFGGGQQSLLASTSAW